MAKSSLNEITKQEMNRARKSAVLFIFLTAATLTGIACVLFMRLFEYTLSKRLDFQSIGPWCWITTPLLFLLSVELIRRFAPLAAGTGIPQTIFAAKHMSEKTESRLISLVSSRTLVIKVVALLLGLWAGASTGREGPTVQIATCVFLLVLFSFRRWFGTSLDLRSAIVAGGAAGLAAAFNTPLAGVTFAIEELTPDYFSSIKDFVLMAIIIAAIAAKSLTGEYTYFGKLMEPPFIGFSVVLLIGVVCGIVGALFSSAILQGQNFLARFHKHPTYRYAVPIIFSLGLLGLAFVAGLRVLGPGNESAQSLLRNEFGKWTLWFPLTKMMATLLTYWSGVAGGIFAPCLSIGASLGADVGHWMNVPITSCALVGMAAFLSGTIQAPITSFVIIFEMTGNHQMLLPIMLSSLLAAMVARLLGAHHLYKSLANNYKYLLD